MTECDESKLLVPTSHVKNYQQHRLGQAALHCSKLGRFGGCKLPTDYLAHANKVSKSVYPARSLWSCPVQRGQSDRGATSGCIAGDSAGRAVTGQPARPPAIALRTEVAVSGGRRAAAVGQRGTSDVRCAPPRTVCLVVPAGPVCSSLPADAAGRWGGRSAVSGPDSLDLSPLGGSWGCAG